MRGQLKRVLLGLGLYGALRRRRPSSRPAILQYHAVAGPEGRDYASSGITVSPAEFERQVRYLSRRYVIVDMDAIEGYLQGQRQLPPNTLAFTFDDGYFDNLAASRILARYGANATFYLTTGRLEGQRRMWPVEVRMRVVAAASPRIELRWEGQRLEFPLRDAAEREVSISRFNSWIKKRTVAERERFLAYLAGALPLDESGGNGRPAIMLDWRQARAMQDAGMLIGGHTRTHANLVHATDDEALQEIRGCHEALQRELGSARRHLAYPNGGADRHVDERAKRLVREAGFGTAVTSLRGLVGPDSDPFELGRIRTGPSLADLIHELEWSKLGARDV